MKCVCNIMLWKLFEIIPTYILIKLFMQNNYIYNTFFDASNLHNYAFPANVPNIWQLRTFHIAYVWKFNNYGNISITERDAFSDAIRVFCFRCAPRYFPTVCSFIRIRKKMFMDVAISIRFNHFDFDPLQFASVAKEISGQSRTD